MTKQTVATKNKETTPTSQGSKSFYIESYGCQMNFSDSEIVASMLHEAGYHATDQVEHANIILLNTCSIREKAEQTVRNRLKHLQKYKTGKHKAKIGVLGCMAERLKKKLLEEEQIVDLVAGPDAYRDIENLVDKAVHGQEAVNVILSKEETYDNIEPVKLNTNGVSAFVTIMRGCDNMCTFCVVPYTRGRERSRDPQSIIEEARSLYSKGYREITLLGQNVDSYLWYGGGAKKDFKKADPLAQETALSFSGLLESIAKLLPNMRIRFSTSNPQDMEDDVLYTMAKYANICNYIHLPVQSGSSRVLEMMKRGYDREKYIERVDAIRRIVPNCAISQDIIAGFPGETEQDHKDTLSLMEYVKYQTGFMFKYSERPNTPAAKTYEDDIPEEVKSRRLSDIISLQQQHSLEQTKQFVGQEVIVLIESDSKRNPNQWQGRNDQNITTVFDKQNYTKGQYVKVHVTDCTSTTLIGEPIALIEQL